MAATPSQCSTITSFHQSLNPKIIRKIDAIVRFIVVHRYFSIPLSPKPNFHYIALEQAFLVQKSQINASQYYIDTRFLSLYCPICDSIHNDPLFSQIVSKATLFVKNRITKRYNHFKYSSNRPRTQRPSGTADILFFVGDNINQLISTNTPPQFPKPKPKFFGPGIRKIGNTSCISSALHLLAFIPQLESLIKNSGLPASLGLFKQIQKSFKRSILEESAIRSVDGHIIPIKIQKAKSLFPSIADQISESFPDESYCAFLIQDDINPSVSVKTYPSTMFSQIVHSYNPYLVAMITHLNFCLLNLSTSFSHCQFVGLHSEFLNKTSSDPLVHDINYLSSFYLVQPALSVNTPSHPSELPIFEPLNPSKLLFYWELYQKSSSIDVNTPISFLTLVFRCIESLLQHCQLPSSSLKNRPLNDTNESYSSFQSIFGFSQVKTTFCTKCHLRKSHTAIENLFLYLNVTKPNQSLSDVVYSYFNPSSLESCAQCSSDLTVKISSNLTVHGKNLLLFLNYSSGSSLRQPLSENIFHSPKIASLYLHSDQNFILSGVVLQGAKMNNPSTHFYCTSMRNRYDMDPSVTSTLTLPWIRFENENIYLHSRHDLCQTRSNVSSDQSSLTPIILLYSCVSSTP